MKHTRHGSALAYALMIAAALALVAYLFSAVLARTSTQTQAAAAGADVGALARESLPLLGEQMIARVHSAADAKLAAGAPPLQMRENLAGLCLEQGGVSVRAHFLPTSCPGGLSPELRRVLGSGGGEGGALNDHSWPLLIEVTAREGEATGFVAVRGRLRVRSGGTGVHAYAILARRMEGGIEAGAVFSGPVHVAQGVVRGAGRAHFQNTVTSGVQPGFEWAGASGRGLALPCSGPGCPTLAGGFRAGAGATGVFPGGGAAPVSGSPLVLNDTTEIVLNGYPGTTELIACGSGPACAVYRTNGNRLERWSVPAGRPGGAGTYTVPPGTWQQELASFSGVVQVPGALNVRALGGPAYSGALHLRAGGTLSTTGNILAVTPACTRPASVQGGTYVPPTCQNSTDILGLSAGGNLVLLGGGVTVQAHLAALTGQVSAQFPSTVTGSVVGDSVAPGNLRITHDPRAVNGQAPPAWPLLGSSPWPSVVAMSQELIGD